MKPSITKIHIPSDKYGVGRAASISQISEHHAVGDASHVIAKAQGSAIFSTTFTIAMDGTIYQLVDEANTPYCDNAWQSNARSITIEHAGGGSFPYTEAMYQSSIKLHRYLFSKYGNLNCVRHRDIPEIKADPSKATACPGILDVEKIIREAKGTPMDEGTVHNLYLSGWQRKATAGELTQWVGKPMQDFFYAGGKNQYEYLWQEIRNRDKAIADLQQASKFVPLDEPVYVKKES